MEEIKKEHTGLCEHMCQTGWCKKMCCGGKHTLLRWIFGIIILIAVFSLGVKVGEFKSIIDGYKGSFGWNSHRGNPMMFYGYDDAGHGDNFGPRRMMRGINQIPQQNATSTQK
ncbi:MAG: hypothetical protein AB1333_01285 [Patescibacteria group bacterium]